VILLCQNCSHCKAEHSPYRGDGCTVPGCNCTVFGCNPPGPRTGDAAHAAAVANLLGALSYALDSAAFFAVDANSGLLMHYIEAAQTIRSELVKLNHSQSKKV
jgi:hypothetical protein